MGSPALQNAYDDAAAIFSRSFRFVEWKFIITAPGHSIPFGDQNEPRHKAIREIDRDKWIYVFRHNVGEQYAQLKEEIRIDKKGEMAATPHLHDDDLEKEILKRGKPAPIGKTMCLPRRIFGKPKVYRFFASRVQLPPAQIKELEKTIYTFAPATNLEPGENASVVEKDGELLVPVVDPITVLLHLHTAFVAAANDLINYTATHRWLSATQRNAVVHRRKKQLLAQLLMSIMDSDKSNTFVAKLKGGQGPVEDYLKHHDEEVQWRIGRRDRLGNYVVNWLASDAMKIVAEAHKSTKTIWNIFLVPWCHAVTRLGETPAGRDYLDKLLGDQTHFIHEYVWPSYRQPDDWVQATRKWSMTYLEAFKAFAERRILRKAPDYVKETLEKLENLRRVKGELQTGPITRKTIEKGVEVEKKIRRLYTDTPTLRDVEGDEHYWAGGTRKVAAIIESVNFVIAVQTLMEKLEDEKATREDKEVAIIGLVGSTLDATGGIASLFESGEEFVPFLGFVSSVIDVYIGVISMNKAFRDGDQDIANGSFLTAAGATIAAASAFMGILAIPGAQIVAVLGLFVIAVGFVYKLVAGDSPMERFFAHCTWGNDYLSAGGADWSPTRFEEWKQEKEFDNQFTALLNIICKFTIGSFESIRDLKYEMGWLPPNSKLVVSYEEKWEDEAAQKLYGDVIITDKIAVSNPPWSVASREGKSTIKLEVLSSYLSKNHPTVESVPNATETRQFIEKLERSVATGSLLVTLDGKMKVTIPHDGAVKRTLVEDQILKGD